MNSTVLNDLDSKRAFKGLKNIMFSINSLVSYARNRGEICKCLNKYQTSFNRFLIPFSSKFSPETIFYSWQLPQMNTPFFTVGKIRNI